MPCSIPGTLRPGGASVKLKTGTQLADRYVVKERLGTCERGAVYRALDLSWGKDVALKVLLPEVVLVPGTMERLANMLRRALGFVHPAICGVHSLGRSDGHVFIASELVRGETLRQYHDRLRAHHVGTGLKYADICAAMKPVCEALVYMSGLAPHLNLKPENVLLTSSGQVKITDFGLDEVVTVIPRGRSRAMTEQRRFRAPEQICRARNLNPGQEAVDARADQYSVATMTYFLAAGEVPSTGASDLASRRPDLPVKMAQTVNRALSGVPEARYETTATFTAAMFATPSKLDTSGRCARRGHCGCHSGYPCILVIGSRGV